MLGNAGIYAAKKRKKPVQKIPKPPPPEGVKSNPSKRHRDRLNGELDKLTSLLPFSEDVRARLDKLSVLRLSVGYLKVKSYFKATMKPSIAWPGQGPFVTGGQTVSSVDGVSFSEGDLLLQALNGFVMVVTAEGYVFYSSPTIQDYLGFHQSDVVHQSVFELIHTDDRAMFRRQLHFALKPTDCTEEGDAMQASSEITSNLMNYNPVHIPPENSSFLERIFCCRFRCLLDNSSGFLALNFQGRLKYLHGQNKMAEDGTMAHPQLALFVIATPLQPPSILEIRSKTLIFQTKHKLDFTPMGVDTRGKVVLGYTEIELCMRGSGYQFIHAADMMYCADNHVRMMKTGESGFTVFRLLTKGGTWLWVQANARLVYKQGRPDFIVARQRALTNEEGEEHLRQRKIKLPFNFATGEAVLYETSPPLDIAAMPSQGKHPPKMPKLAEEMSLDPDSLLGSMLKQDQMLYGNANDSSNMDANGASVQFPPVTLDVPLDLPMDKAFLDSHALLSVPGGETWQHPQAGAAVPMVKSEASVKDMVETLQQIITDASLCPELQLDMGQLELKEWESTLLRMHATEGAVELNDILTNDIFSYVEGLLEDNGLHVSAPGQDGFGDELPDCLPFSEAQQPQGNRLGNLHGNGLPDPMGAPVPAPAPPSVARGTVKLTHMGPDISLAQSVPTHSVAQRSGQGGMVGMGNGASLQGFNPAALASQYGQPQPQFQPQPQPQTLFQPQPQTPFQFQFQGQGRSSVPQRRILTGQQEMLGQVPPKTMAVPAMPATTLAFQGQQPPNEPNGQDGPWLSSSLPDSVSMTTDGMLGASVQAEQMAPSSACLQGRFSVLSQHGQNHSQGMHSWPTQQNQQQLQQHQIHPQNQQTQQQLPNPLSNGQQHVPNCYAQTPDFQRDTLVKLLPQSAPSFGSAYRPQTNPNSCMFNSSPPAVTHPANPAQSAMINGAGFAHRGADGSLGGYKMNGLHHHSPSQPQVQPQPQQASFFYQRNPADALGAATVPVSALRQIGTQDALSQLAAGISPESLLAQQFLNCNGQSTQITNPLIKDNDTFPFPGVGNEATYFAESSQANCCDY